MNSFKFLKNRIRKKKTKQVRRNDVEVGYNDFNNLRKDIVVDISFGIIFKKFSPADPTPFQIPTKKFAIPLVSAITGVV